MNSGTSSLKCTCNFDSSEFTHIDVGCKGAVKLLIGQNEPYYLHPRIAINAPIIIKFYCESCGTTTIPNEFRKTLESLVVVNMLLSNKILPPLFLRFCRTFFGLTQKEVAEILGLSSKQYMAFENEKGGTRIQANELTILKMEYLSRIEGVTHEPLPEVFKRIHTKDLTSAMKPLDLFITEDQLRHFRQCAEEHGAVMSG